MKGNFLENPLIFIYSQERKTLHAMEGILPALKDKIFISGTSRKPIFPVSGDIDLTNRKGCCIIIDKNAAKKSI